MKSTITPEKIKRLERKYGKYVRNYAGWLTFENAIVSPDENVILKTKEGAKAVKYHSTKNDESSYIVGLN